MGKWAVPRENQFYGLCGIGPDQLSHAAQANPDTPVDFLFQEAWLYPPETEYVSPDKYARTAQADLVDTLRRGHTVCFLEGRLKFRRPLLWSGFLHLTEKCIVLDYIVSQTIIVFMQFEGNRTKREHFLLGSKINVYLYIIIPTATRLISLSLFLKFL